MSYGKSAKPTRVVGYARVSTEGQADDGVSLDAQRARLTAYATALELVLVEVVVDAGVSAKTLHRPGLGRALAMLEAGEADGLLVVKLDRLTRSVRDLGTLLEGPFAEKRGAALLSVSDAIDTRTANGRMMLNVLTSVAQWERETTVERTRLALAHLKQQGVRLGFPPHEASKQGARAVARLVALRSEGRSLRAIAAAMNDEGHPSRRGGRWGPEAVRKMLARHASRATPG